MRISDWSSDVCSSDLIQYHFVPAMLEDHGRTKVKGHGFSCLACVLRPESRGSVTLASRDAAAAPAIDPGFLTEARDMATRSDERRVGKAGVSTGRSRWAPYHQKKHTLDNDPTY